MVKSVDKIKYHIFRQTTLVYHNFNSIYGLLDYFHKIQQKEKNVNNKSSLVMWI